MKSSDRNKLSTNPGVYIITNTSTVIGKRYVYIGQAKNLRRRFVGHWNALKAAEFRGGTNKRLYNSWNCGKYKPKDFKFEVIEEIVEKFDNSILKIILDTIEDYYLIKNENISYNFDKLASGPIGCIRSKEARRNMSNAHEKHSIIVWDILTQKQVGIYESINEAQRQLNIGGISCVLRGNSLTRNGYTFSYEGEMIADKRWKEIQEKSTPSTKSKTVVQISFDGLTEIARFPSAREAARQVPGTKHERINLCCRTHKGLVEHKKKRYRNGGYIWKYAE